MSQKSVNPNNPAQLQVECVNHGRIETHDFYSLK